MGLAGLALFAQSSFASPILESSRSTLYILLNTFSGRQSVLNANDCWNEDLKIYIQDKIVGRSGHVFCAAYDLSSQSPAGYANDLAKTVFPEALENWFASSDDPKILGYKKEGWGLPELKSGRPDLVPLRYVVIANGPADLPSANTSRAQVTEAKFRTYSFSTLRTKARALRTRRSFRRTWFPLRRNGMRLPWRR